ncbi:hypothetical protein [Nocardia sp. NPDC059239]|uniref:hypothetical protein n=1 Tax=unclassified Nocardia TaxID=2637762 RepID=UPI00368C8DA0
MANQAHPVRAEKLYAPMHLGSDATVIIAMYSIVIQPATAPQATDTVDGVAGTRLGYVTFDDCDRPVLTPCEHATARTLERLIAATTDIVEFEQPSAGAEFDVWAREEMADRGQGGAR